MSFKRHQLDKPWFDNDEIENPGGSKLEKALYYFDQTSKHLWTQINSLRQENQRIIQDMIFLWTSNQELKQGLLQCQRNIEKMDNQRQPILNFDKLTDEIKDVSRAHLMDYKTLMARINALENVLLSKPVTKRLTTTTSSSINTIEDGKSTCF